MFTDLLHDFCYYHQRETKKHEYLLLKEEIADSITCHEKYFSTCHNLQKKKKCKIAISESGII